MFDFACCAFDDNFGQNSGLLTNNNFFNLVKTCKKLYLIHTTKNKERILQDGYLYPSSGCLIGSIYLTPGFEQTNGSIRLHNLGAYYYTKEAPTAIKLKNLTSKPDIFIIEINLKKDEKVNISGVNYLKLGQLHFDIYNKLNYLLTNDEKKNLENITLKRIENAYTFLSSFLDYSQHTTETSKRDFLNLFISQIQHLPILGYVYFEALTKSMMLHQNDEISLLYKENGEFYNWHYKDLMSYLYPHFFSNFSLGTFTPHLNNILMFIQQNKIISSTDMFLNDFYSQLFKLSTDVLQFKNNTSLTLPQTFADLPSSLMPLAGHIIHRELRNFSRYPDFYFYFEQIKALEMWNFWNKQNVLIPFNGIIPKGEIGLNPAYVENIQYNIYEGVNFKEKNNFLYIEKGAETNLKIATRLVEQKHLFMRNSNG